MTGTRQALSLLHAALENLEARSDTADPAVRAALAGLRDAAAAYEGTVAETLEGLAPAEPPTPSPTEPGEPVAYGPRVSVISRWDFSVLDRDKLIAEAESLMGEEVGDVATSITLLAHVGARLGLAAGGNAKQAGLFWHGTITMAMPCEVAELGDAWVQDAPFARVDPDESLCFITDALDATAVPGVHQFDE
ncbi:MAG: hypothetical protein ACT4QF_21945 [Sporichthyaceae bacterium]